jgi:hypothetical protein
MLVPENLLWDLIDHILIAWNGTLEASHAVFGVLPLLHKASRVSVFSMPGPENDGATSAAGGATRIVTGADTHSRLRQSFLGRVTRHVLFNATIPVVMSH